MTIRPLLALGLLACAVAPARAQDAADVEHGRQLFAARCVVCHGPNADGQGQLAKMLEPKPANLRASRLDFAARNAIVRGGGASVGRSAAMPRWEAELSEEELRGVIAYVGTLAPQPGAAKPGSRP